MKTPKVLVALSDNSGRDMLLVMRSDSQGIVHEVHWALAKLESAGYVGACDMVGNAVLRMLADPHEETFRQYPRLFPPKPLASDPYFMIVELFRFPFDIKP